MLDSIKQEVIAICQKSYRDGDRAGYLRIEEILQGVEGEEAARIRRLAKAGPTLSSPRFAYPHIEEIAAA